MGYSPEDNPYLPGDPYSYDLKWMVDKMKGWKDPLDSAERAKTSEEAAAASAEAADLSAQAAADSATTAEDYAAHIADPVSGIVTDWLAEHITQPTTPAIDKTLAITDTAADSKVTGDQLETKITGSSSEYVEGYRTYMPGKFYYISGGVITSTDNAYYDTYIYELKNTLHFKISATIRGSSNYLIIVTDSNGALIERYEQGSSGVNTTYTDYEKTIHNLDGGYVYLSFGNGEAHDIKVSALRSDYDIYQDDMIAESLRLGNRWKNKNIVCFGDSRTWYDGHAYTANTKADIRGEICVGYQQQIKDLLGAVVTSEGSSGDTSVDICARILAYDFTDFDAVLLEGGVNDFIKSSDVTIGSIMPIGSVFDTSTVYGAWQAAIEYILTNFPALKIYMDIPAIAWKGVDDDMFPYSTAEIKGEIAALYNLPCKNLYKEGGINVLNRDAFYADDTSLTNNWHLHFNDEGNALIGAELAMFINNN